MRDLSIASIPSIPSIATIATVFAAGALLVLSCSKDGPRGPSDEELAVFKSKLDTVERMSAAKTAAWRETLGKAIAGPAPQLAGECPVRYDYPFAYFDSEVWAKVGIGEWSDARIPAHAQVANFAVEMAERDLADNPRLVSMTNERLNAVASETYWDHELTLLRQALVVPEQGDEGTYTAGAYLVRALLYSYQTDAVICQALYQVTNADTIEVSFTMHGTEREIREQKARQQEVKPDDALMTEIVALDLQKRAFYAAKSRLRAVVDRAADPGQPQPL